MWVRSLKTNMTVSLFSHSAESVSSILPRLFLFGCDTILERNISCAAAINTFVIDVRDWPVFQCSPVYLTVTDWMCSLHPLTWELARSSFAWLCVSWMGPPFTAAFCVSASVSLNPSRSQQMAAHTEPGSAGGFFLLKGSFSSPLSLQAYLCELMQSTGFPQIENFQSI